jgi:hypothetical protein
MAAWAGVGISASSIVVAIIALKRSSKAHRETIDIQKKVVKIEEERESDRKRRSKSAVLKAEMRETSKGGNRLYVINSGEAGARNVKVWMDGKPLNEHRASVKGSEIPTLIGPHSEGSCFLALTLACSPPFDLKINWDDDYDEHREYRSTVT